MYKCIILLLTVITYSCNVKSNDFEKKYLDVKSNFPYHFVGHFPNSVWSTNAMYSVDTSTSLNNIAFFFEVVAPPKFYLDSVRGVLGKKSIAVYRANDPTLFVVNKFTTKDNYRNYYKYPDNYEFDLPDTIYNKIPVPNFFRSPYSQLNTPSRLDSTFTLYTLECEKGVHWDEYHVQKENYMPEYWKHGYSKGVAISEEKQVVIFWFICW